MSSVPRPQEDGPLVSLLRAAARGDPRSREELLVALHEPLRRYALRSVARRADPDDLADDIAQEALIRIGAHVARCQARSDAEVLAWSLAIARNLLLDFLRAEARLEVLPLVAEIDSAPSPTTSSQEERVRRRVLRAVLRSLPEDTVRLLQLRAQCGASWPEIAQEFGTTASAAKRRFQRAQVRLRRDVLQEIATLPTADRARLARWLRRIDPGES